MRRPAPYRHEVAAVLAAGRNPSVHIFAGPDAWQRAEHRRRIYGLGTAMVLPAGEVPEAFDWPNIKPEAILITGHDPRAGQSLRTRLFAACAGAACTS